MNPETTKSPLKNGNPQFDLRNVRRCGARNRRGLPCRASAMRNGRCKFHGGKSTGPRTPEGLERSRRAAWKNGLYSAAAIAEHQKVQEFVKSIHHGKGMLSIRSLDIMDSMMPKMTLLQRYWCQCRVLECLEFLEARIKKNI